MSEKKLCGVKVARAEAEAMARKALFDYLVEEGCKTAAEIAKENDMSVGQVRGLIVHTQCNTRYDGRPRVRVVNKKRIVRKFVELNADNTVNYDKIITASYRVNVYGVQ